MAGTTGTAALRVTMDGSGMEKGLTKIQKELNLVKDAQGRLFNQTGQWVDGLSKAQVQMGLQRDALGQLRDGNFELVEGLKTYEIQAGFTVDALGNVFNAQGMLVRQGEKQMAANKLLEASQNKFGKAIRQSASPVMHLATQIAILGGANSSAAARTTAMIGTFMSSYGAAQTMIKGIQGIMAATKSATLAQILYNAMSGQWKKIAAGLVIAAAATAAATASFGSSAREAAKDVDGLSDSVGGLSDEMKRLKEIAKETGRLVNDLQNYAQLAEEKTYSTLYKANQEILKQAKYQEEQEERKNRVFGAYENMFDSYFNKNKKEEYWEGQNFLAETGIQELVRIEDSVKNKFEKEREQIIQQINVLKNIVDTQPQYKERALNAIEYLKEAMAKTHQAEYEASDEYKKIQERREEDRKIEEERKKELERYRANAVKMAADAELANMTESERRQKKIHDELDIYLMALGERNKLSKEEERQINRAIEERKKELENIETYAIRKEIEEEKRKEESQRNKFDNLQSLIAEGGEDVPRYQKMLDDIQNQTLGDFKKYFDETAAEIKDFGQKFSIAGDELVETARKAGKTTDEIIGALGGMKEELQKEALAQVQSLNIGMPSAATFQSVEAYKTIARAKDPSIQAIKSFENAVLAKLDAGFRELSDSYKNGAIGAMP